MRRFIKSKFINLGIKLLVVCLLLYVLYYQVFARENIHELWAAFRNNLDSDHLYWLYLAVVFMPLNWAFETLKWKVLVHKFEDISFWKTYKAIFAGITFSILTPNRIGEYGGRILLVKPENNWKAVIATLVGSFSQLLVLLSVGFLGLGYFIYQFLDLEPYLLKGILFIGIILISLMLFCFFNIDLIVPIVKKLPFIHKFKKYVKHVNVLRNYKAKDLAMALFFALARYIVYTLQYYFILRFFGIDLPLISGLAGIATIYLLQTSIPLPPLMGLLARGEVALFVWGHFSSSELSILASTFSLWILNLIFPALIGLIFIININVLKSLGYENDNQKEIKHNHQKTAKKEEL